MIKLHNKNLLAGVFDTLNILHEYNCSFINPHKGFRVEAESFGYTTFRGLANLDDTLNLLGLWWLRDD